MMFDARILGTQFDGAFQMADSLLEIAQLVLGPAQAVDDVSVVGTQLGRLLDHFLGPLQVAPLLDPGIAQIIEHIRLVGF